MIGPEKRESLDLLGTSSALIAIIGIVVIGLSLYSVLSMLSPVVKTFDDVVVDKKTNTVVVLVGQVATTVTRYLIVVESGKTIQVTPDQYAVIEIGDTVLVAIKQNGEYILDNNGGVK